MVARIALALALALPFAAWGQSFNGTFEALQPSGIPTGWSSADPGGAAVTPEAHLGKRAIKAWVFKNYEPGSWISNTSAADGNAAEVTGYYKYLGDKKECEKASVSYILGAKGANAGIDTMAFGQVELKLSKEYTKFQLNVSAMGTGTPDFMSIQIKPSGHCNIHGATNCCFLYVDDIILAGTTSIAEPAMEEEPRPAEEVTDSVAPAPQPEETQPPATEPTDDGIAPEPTEMEPTTPAETPKEAVEETPEEPTPAEEESTEPIEEGWDKGEESNDGGQK
jgi:hypothetical protein